MKYCRGKFYIGRKQCFLNKLVYEQELQLCNLNQLPTPKHWLVRLTYQLVRYDSRSKSATSACLNL